MKDNTNVGPPGEGEDAQAESAWMNALTELRTVPSTLPAPPIPRGCGDEQCSFCGEEPPPPSDEHTECIDEFIKEWDSQEEFPGKRDIESFVEAVKHLRENGRIR
jgi:hypothetical protein